MSDIQASIDFASAAIAADTPFYLGPQLLSCAFENVLLGLLFCQVTNYYQRFPKDAPITKFLVTSLFVLNLANSATGFAYDYYLFVEWFGNYAKTLVGVYVSIHWILSSTTCLLAQAFFLSRAYRLRNNNKYLLAIGSFTTFSGFALGYATVIWLVRLGNSALNAAQITNVLVAWKAVTTFTDLLLTGLIMLSLFQARTGIQRADAHIGTVFRITAEAQLFPTICALAFLITYAVIPSSGWPLFFSFIETKLYALSVVHALNCRKRLRSNYNVSDSIDDVEVNRAGMTSSNFPISRRPSPAPNFITKRGSDDASIRISDHDGFLALPRPALIARRSGDNSAVQTIRFETEVGDELDEKAPRNALSDLREMLELAPEIQEKKGWRSFYAGA